MLVLGSSFRWLIPSLIQFRDISILLIRLCSFQVEPIISFPGIVGGKCKKFLLKRQLVRFHARTVYVSLIIWKIVARGFVDWSRRILIQIFQIFPGIVNSIVNNIVDIRRDRFKWDTKYECRDSLYEDRVPTCQDNNAFA